MKSRKPSKLEVALFLLGKPAYYPDLWRRVRLNIGRALLPPVMGRSAEVATRWAASVAVDLDKVDLLAPGLRRSLAADFPAEIGAAREMEEKYPTQKGWGGSADLIYAVCEAIGAKTVVETGVAQGFSTLAMLLSVTRRGGRVQRRYACGCTEGYQRGWYRGAATFAHQLVPVPVPGFRRPRQGPCPGRPDRLLSLRQRQIL